MRANSRLHPSSLTAISSGSMLDRGSFLSTPFTGLAGPAAWRSELFGQLERMPTLLDRALLATNEEAF